MYVCVFCDSPDDVSPTTKVFAIIQIILSAVGIIGNLIVIYVVIVLKEYKKSTSIL